MEGEGQAIMSFLLDPPALVIIGFVIGRYVRSNATRIRLAIAAVAIFLCVSALLYINVLPWWLGEWITGSDWMLNSGLNTDLTRQPGTDVLAFVMFSAYPLWMSLGLKLGGRWS